MPALNNGRIKVSYNYSQIKSNSSHIFCMLVHVSSNTTIKCLHRPNLRDGFGTIPFQFELRGKQSIQAKILSNLALQVFNAFCLPPPLPVLCYKIMFLVFPSSINVSLLVSLPIPIKIKILLNQCLFGTGHPPERKPSFCCFFLCKQAVA